MKILVIHASAGAGHTRAAEALFGEFKERSDSVVLENSLDFTSGFYKRSYQATYSFLITHAPWVWGFFCWLTDIPWLQKIVRICRRGFNALMARQLADYFRRENFDCIFSTHFMAHEVACALKRQGLIKSRIIVVVTDFDVHRIWLAAGVDHYTVATTWTADKLKQLGVPEVKIKVTGIPVDRKFNVPRDVRSLRDHLGVPHRVFTVLMATGSFGIGPIEEIVGALRDIQLLVICGRNTALYDRLREVRWDHVHVFGLVDNMEEFMAASDAMITKPGGLSISEALVCGLPLVFFSAIPGQETHNIRVLKHFGVGVCPDNVQDILEEIRKLSADSEYFNHQKSMIRTIARPHAARDVLNLIT